MPRGPLDLILIFCRAISQVIAAAVRSLLGALAASESAPRQALIRSDFPGQGSEFMVKKKCDSSAFLNADAVVPWFRTTRQSPSVKNDRRWSESSVCSSTDEYPEDEETIDTLMMLRVGGGHSDESDNYSDGFDSDDSTFTLACSDEETTGGEFMVELGSKPRVFDDAATIAFYISPKAIAQLAAGLWTRSRPACVIINTSIPRGMSFDEMDWCPDSMRMLSTPNAGGSSLLSEVLSCEMLSRCLNATLAKTEMEIRYLFAYQPITDYTITLPNLAPGLHVGVSVTRAFAFKNGGFKGGAYRRADCRKLLKKKLKGILASTRNVVDERLFKQILHVWVPNGKVARTVQATYKSLPLDITRNTVVIVSVVNAAWVFSNRR
ncbi:hypothetical protein BGZ68_009224 [Mortierella alpina]|nr:hypothetical protein BGZ68_009224 [Mortierella alpina]